MDGITGAVQSDPGAGSSKQVTLGMCAMHYYLLKVLHVADCMFCSRRKYSVPVEAGTNSHSLPHRGELAADRTLWICFTTVMLYIAILLFIRVKQMTKTPSLCVLKPLLRWMPYFFFATHFNVTQMWLALIAFIVGFFTTCPTNWRLYLNGLQKECEQGTALNP